jgi:DNA-binding transcriptional MerR regulator
MNQLTIGDILSFIKKLQREGMTTKEIAKLPVYLGQDDELNGIHTAWYTNLVDPGDPECEYFVEMINEDRHNIKLAGKAILIS